MSKPRAEALASVLYLVRQEALQDCIAPPAPEPSPLTFQEQPHFNQAHWVERATTILKHLDAIEAPPMTLDSLQEDLQVKVGQLLGFEVTLVDALAILEIATYQRPLLLKLLDRLQHRERLLTGGNES